MSLLGRIEAARAPGGAGSQRSSVDQWLTDYLIPAVESGMFSHNGHSYPYGLNTTYGGQRIQEVSATLPGHMAALRSSPVAFAAQAMRARVLSQVRFKFRNRETKKIFGNTRLLPLEAPWVNATTGDMVSLMEWHAGLAGNAYAIRRPDRLRVLRPDWTGILYGSDLEPDELEGAMAGHMLDGEIIGYVYQAGGIGQGRTAPQLLLPADVAHWKSTIPDPESPGTGMSWLTPAIRDIQGDKLATQHKLEYFANAATPNIVVKGIAAKSQTDFDKVVDMLEARHKGLGNAYRTLYLTAGADATVVGSDLKQIDFSETLASGEVRITMLSGVPASLLGIAKGLEGSSLNTGNFGAARRSFGDTWVKPSLQDLSASLAPLVDVPADAEMWFDASDIALLHEDAKDAADIQFTLAQTIRQWIEAGFDPDSAVAAATAQDPSRLKHTGLVSVQLQPPGSTTPTGAPDDSDSGREPPRPRA
jgi:phage portal protein BeeE